MRSFEIRGRWYLPREPDRQVPGTLVFVEGQGPHLSLHGTFLEAFAGLTEQERILGDTSGDCGAGSSATLVKCFTTQRNFSGNGIWSERIQVNTAYLGTSHLPDDPVFYGATLRLPHLSTWLHPRPLLQLKHNEKGVPYIIEPQLPEQLHVKVPEGMIEFGFGASGNVNHTRAAIDLDAEILLHLENPLSEGDLNARLIGPLQNLMSFVTGQPCGLSKLLLFGPERVTQWEVVYDPLVPSPRAEDLGRLFLPLRPPLRLEDLVQRWLIFSKKRRAFAEVYFGLEAAPPGFVEQRLAGMLHAASLLLKEESKPWEGWRTTVLNDLEARAAAKPEWAEGILASAAELSLPWLLRDLIEKHRPVVQETIPDPDQFIGDLLRAREWITSRETRPAGRATTGKEVYLLSQRLRVLLQAAILSDLVSHEVAVSAMEGQPHPDW